MPSMLLLLQEFTLIPTKQENQTAKTLLEYFFYPNISRFFFKNHIVLVWHKLHEGVQHVQLYLYMDETKES